jgi:EXLDI family protein
LDLDLHLDAGVERAYRLDVYDTIEQFGEHIPTELFEMIRTQGAIPEVEDLDI